jgi:hypothetical protein
MMCGGACALLGNRELKGLEDRARPLFEREEKARKANLNPVERMKEDGYGRQSGKEGLGLRKGDSGPPLI